MKRALKMMLIKFKNRGRRVRFGRKANIGYKAIFEGCNTLGNGTFFTGKMGFGSYIGNNSSVNAVIGRYCCIGERVTTVIGIHPTRDFVSIHPAFFSTSRQDGFTYVSEQKFEEYSYADDNKNHIIIGNDVWIGAGAMILGGVKIGDGAVVASGAAVTRDVAPYTIVGGVPAKPIRKRFEEKRLNFS